MLLPANREGFGLSGSELLPGRVSGERGGGCAWVGDGSWRGRLLLWVLPIFDALMGSPLSLQPCGMESKHTFSVSPTEAVQPGLWGRRRTHGEFPAPCPLLPSHHLPAVVASLTISPLVETTNTLWFPLVPGQ